MTFGASRAKTKTLSLSFNALRPGRGQAAVHRLIRTLTVRRPARAAASPTGLARARASVTVTRVLNEVALCGEVRASLLLAPLPNGLATQLFAYLVLHRRRPLQHAALADAPWTTARPRNPRAVVSSLLSRLRRSLGPDVLPTGPAVRLVLPAATVVDVDEAAAALVGGARVLDAAATPTARWHGLSGRARSPAAACWSTSTRAGSTRGGPTSSRPTSTRWS